MSLPFGYITVRVEDTGDGLIINAADAYKWNLKTDYPYKGKFQADGTYRIAIYGDAVGTTDTTLKPEGEQQISDDQVNAYKQTFQIYLETSKKAFGPKVSYEATRAGLKAAMCIFPKQISGEAVERRFKLGDRVRKIKGSSWQGHVVGFYCTELTPIGYNVESEREPGSVQLYPEAALEGVSP